MNSPVLGLAIEIRRTADLIRYHGNARTHSPEQVTQIAASISEFGFVNPILIGADDDLIAGHGRLDAAELLGLDEVPVIVLAHLTPAQRRALIIADNQIPLNAGWDEAALAREVAWLKSQDYDLDVLGFGEDQLTDLLNGLEDGIYNRNQDQQPGGGSGEGFGAGQAAGDSGGGGEPGQAEPKRSLMDRFGIAPFTIFDARKGWWQDRKKAWLALGIRSELGRGDADPDATGDAKAFNDGAQLGKGGLSDQVAAAATARRARKAGESADA